MRRRFEQLIPWGVFLGFAATAVVVSLLLAHARDRSVAALTASLEAEVDALASTQDQRINSNLFAASALVSDQNFDFEVQSEHDRASLDSLAELVGPVSAGFYLIDLDGVITEGVAIDDELIGTQFEWPGFSLEALQVGRPQVLPVAEGLTTSQPTFSYVLSVQDENNPIGGFVFEVVVEVANPFNQEISVLERGETGEYFVLDASGTVIAANNPAAVGEPIDDPQLLALSEGSSRIGDELVAISDVPSTGWRVAFRQDAAEFESALSRPLSNVGTLVVLALLLAGAVLTVVLYRRLRSARAEQERLRALGAAQAEFVSIVSHELRTPVAGVLGFLETSLDHWDTMSDEDRRSAVSRAAVNARRLQAMARDVLDTQSLEEGRLVHSLAPVDLAAEVDIAVEAAKETGEERAFEVTLPDEPVWVRGDADRLHQVLTNLLENARKNSPAAQPIEVEVRTEGSEAHVSVADHGTGIAPESVERIFDKFVRGRGDSVSGSGLGLYISRQIINAHEGRVWAESEPGRGAVFRFVLPLSTDPDEDRTNPDPEVVNT